MIITRAAVTFLFSVEIKTFHNSLLSSCVRMTKAHLEIARKTILKLVTANTYIRIFSDIKQLNYRTTGCRALDKASIL